MNTIQKLKQKFSLFLSDTFSINLSKAENHSLELNVDEQKQQFGDLTSNAAMGLARKLKQNPRFIAQKIAESFKDDGITSIEIAGPGFLNFTFAPQTRDAIAQEILQEKTFFFQPKNSSTSSINIEFVSANPTGPLHFGHGRGGIIGDVLGNVLRFRGNKVIKEFYINDAGAQIEKLGRSLKVRCQQVAGMDTTLPEDAYHGLYLLNLANELHTEHGNRLLNQPDLFFSSYAKTKMLEQIKATLHDYGIQFDVWFSEKKLHESSAIEKAISILKKNDLLYEEAGATWFRSTKFGDDKDRVIKKQDGLLTYAAADIAYMLDKIDRGAKKLIYILGHDHHSYAQRLKSIQLALGLDKHPLDVLLYQLVKINEDGEQVRMSKRAGKIVTLQDVIDTVGKDIARFFYLQRKSDAQLEFDLALALTHSDENPVYYIQYAYVRTGSILANAEKELKFKKITQADLKNISDADTFLIKKVASLNDILEVIQNTHQTHLLAYYTHELAQFFNRYYSKNRVIDLEKIDQSRARLALIQIIRNTLAVCLDLLGLSKPERM